METLETTETLSDNSSRKPPESQTLGFLDCPPPVGNEPEAESGIPDLGFQSDSPSLSENDPLLETLAPEPVTEPKTLGMAELGEELGLGLSPEGSPEEVEMDGEESPFSVGDFVWGKIKSHSWWPGQVYDPSRAPDHAVHRKDRHSVLVTYFGGGGVSASWCHPSQLKPFADEFPQMVTQSNSKNFIAAVEAALDEIGQFLESQLTCYCVPEEARARFKKHIAMNAETQVGQHSITNYPPSEFLDGVKEVALDASLADLLRVTMLQSWVTAFGKGCSPTDSSVYHRRRGIMELVDKIDLDDPPADLLDCKEEEECWITGSGAVEGLEVSPEKSISHRGKKKRSMAALIAEMDLDSVELSDDEEKGKSGRKKKKGEESAKGSDLENGTDVKEEEATGSGRRERKKSKYLSPPYTYLSSVYTKCLASPKNSEVKIPRNSLALVTASSTILKCNCEEFPKEEDEKSPLFKIDTTSTAEILLEFLATAVNPLHLKWNRSAKTVRGFFAIFRSSVYSSGAEFDAYQKQLGNSLNLDVKIANTEEACKSDEGKSDRKRRRKKKDGANGENPIDLSHRTVSRSEQVKATAKRKKRKEGVNGDIPANSDIPMVTVSTEGDSGYKKRKGKDCANVEIVESISCFDAGKMEQRVFKRKEIANGKTVIELNREFIEGKLGQRKRKSKDGPGGEAPVNLGSGSTNGLGERKNGGNRKKDVNKYRNRAALLLTFSPGIALPSKDDLISAFSKYGPLIESETELLKESGCARVVFGKSTDAEKAFSDKAGAFGLPIATYRLRYLPENSSAPLTPIPVPKPPLPYIRKNLERMISTLSRTAPPKKDAGTSDGLKPEARDNLVGEMQGLLKKVDKMLNVPAAGTSN